MSRARQRLKCIGEFMLLHERVEGDVDFTIVRVGIADPFVEKPE